MDEDLLPEGATYQEDDALPEGATYQTIDADISNAVKNRLSGELDQSYLPAGASLIEGIDDGSRDRLDKSSFTSGLSSFKSMLGRAGMPFMGESEGPRDNRFHEMMQEASKRAEATAGIRKWGGPFFFKTLMGEAVDKAFPKIASGRAAFSETMGDLLLAPMRQVATAPGLYQSPLGRNLEDTADYFDKLNSLSEKKIIPGFFTQDLPANLGFTAMTLAASEIGRRVGIPPWLTIGYLGSAMGAKEAMDDARAHGADNAQAAIAWTAGSLAGTTEAFSGMRILDRLDKSTGGVILKPLRERGEKIVNSLLMDFVVSKTGKWTTRQARLGGELVLREGIKGFLEEGIQEAFQTMAMDLTAAEIAGYDPDREWLGGNEGKAFGVGGATGFLLSAAATAVGIKLRKTQVHEADAALRAALAKGNINQYGGEFTPLDAEYLELRDIMTREKKALGDSDFVDAAAEAAFGDAQRSYDFLASTDPEGADYVRGSFKSLPSGYTDWDRVPYTHQTHDPEPFLNQSVYSELEGDSGTVGLRLDQTPVVVARPGIVIKLENDIANIEKNIASLPTANLTPSQTTFNNHLNHQLRARKTQLKKAEQFYTDVKNKIANLRKRFNLGEWKIAIVEETSPDRGGSASVLDNVNKIYGIKVNSLGNENLKWLNTVVLHEFGHLVVYNRVQGLVREAMTETRLNRISQFEEEAKAAFEAKNFNAFYDLKDKIEGIKTELGGLGVTEIDSKRPVSTANQNIAHRFFSEWMAWVKKNKDLPLEQVIRSKMDPGSIESWTDAAGNLQVPQADPRYWFNLHEWVADNFTRYAQADKDFVPDKSNPLHQMYADIQDVYKAGGFAAPMNLSRWLNMLTAEGKLRNMVQMMQARGAKNIDDVLEGHVPELADLVDIEKMKNDRDVYNRFLRTFVSLVNLAKENLEILSLQDFIGQLKDAQKDLSKRLYTADMDLKAIKALGNVEIEKMAGALFEEVMDGRPYFPQAPPLTNEPTNVEDLRDPVGELAATLSRGKKNKKNWIVKYDPANPMSSTFEYRGRATLYFEQIGTQPYFFIKVRTPEGTIPNSFNSAAEAFGFMTSAVDGLQRLEAFGLKSETITVMKTIKDSLAKTLDEMQAIATENILRTITKEGDRNKALAEMKKEFDILRAHPYFPLMRFGDWTTTITAREDMEFEGKKYKQGRPIEHHAYETKKERKMHRKELEARFAGLNVAIGELKRSETQMVSQTMPTTFMRNLARQLDLSVEQTQEMETELAQAYPYHTFKKHFTRRKKLGGYSEDIVRSYAAYMRLASSHLMRARHYDGLKGSVIQTKKSGERTMKVGGNADKRMAIADMMESHLKYVMEPAFEWQGLRSFVFFLNFGFNLKAAAVNSTQVLNVTFPYLAARYGDVEAAKAIGEGYATLLRYWRNPNKVSDDIKDVIARGLDEGWIDQSLAMEIALARSSGTLNRALALKAKRGWYNFVEIATWGFHIVEKSNRMVSAIAAYNLAKQVGIAHHGAIGAAETVVEETQFEYSKYARPNFMKHQKGVAFIFMNYMANYLYYVLGQNPGAMRTLLIQLLLAGGLGLPFMDDLENMASWLISWLKKKTGQKDPYTDISASLRDMIQDSWANPDLILHGLSSRSMGLGVSADWMGLPFPDVDISQSLSMGNIIPGDDILRTLSQSGLNDAIAQAAEEGGGVLGGNLMSLLEGIVSDDPDGWKRLEKGMMTAGKNASKAIRMGQRGGEFTRKGDVVARFDMSDPEDVMELMLLGLGFQPSKLNAGWEKEIAILNTVRFYETWKDDLLRSYSNARYNRSPEGVADANAHILRYNNQVPFPQMKISADSKKRSYENYSGTRRKALQGIEPRKTYRRLTRETAEPFEGAGGEQ